MEKRSALERVLGAVTEVEPGEGPTALLLTLNVFLLLTAYYVIKPVREALILVMPSGAEYKSYLGGAIAVALLFAVPAYASAVKRFPRSKLVVGVTLFFASHLLLFYGLSHWDSAKAYLGLIFFVWVGIFNMMVVAQFWAFAADIYTVEKGKRLFALLGVGASVGSAVGGLISKLLIGPLGTYNLLLIATLILGSCALLTYVVDRREISRAPAEAPQAPEEPSKDGAFQLVFKHRYLTLIAAFSLLFTIVNSNGEYILGSLVRSAADAAVAAGTLAAEKKGDFIGGFYGDFFFVVNTGSMLLQTFVVSRLVKYGGMKWTFFTFPVIALLDAAAIAVLPILAVTRWGKTAENAADYSINNTARNMLWLPTTRQMKYVAKQAVDTFFVRMGDVSSALLVFAGAALGWGVRSFALTNLVVVCVWLVLAVAIVREYQRLSREP